ncbi:unnamed protein product [marine sediment metagenome]|uniref:DUF7088 domain-containing protein n=1 Tax=marine sediment metagenome TaxID=412755 RepID=X1I4F1_9ZZZZ
MNFKKIKENKNLREIIFYSSVIIIIAFWVINLLLNQKLFLIGSAIGFLGLILYFILNPFNIKQIFTDKTKKQGSYFVFKTIMILFIVILVFSILNGKLPKLDLTETKIYSLSDITKETLKKIEEPLKIKFFAEGGQGEHSTVGKLLTAYQKENKNITLDFIDPVVRPDLANKYQISEKIQ